MKAGLRRTDWVLGAVVVLVVLAFNRASDLIPSLEQKAYDLGVQSTSRLPSDKVAVIAIDDTSIANIGRWPWSREIHARMTDLLAGAKTKVIANTVFFSEPQIDLIGRRAAALGHLSARPDVDGGVRTEALVLRYFDHHFPSLSLMIAAKSLNLGPGDIKIQLDSVSLGRLRIGTDPQLKMYTYFYGDRGEQPAFPVDSFYDVYSGKIPPTKYTDKIVLIGATAAGIGTYQVTPVSAATPPAVALPHAVSSILQEHFFVVPPWASAAELLIIALVAAYLTVLLPRLKAGPALAISGGVFAGLLVLHFALMRSAGIWMQLMLPATLLLIGHAALVSKRFIVTERAKLKSDETSAEPNRMLGLAYQGQGQLDLAWDKFRQVPLSEALLDNLYNLALDFERKRQFNKAEGVFRYMHEFNPKFRDLEFRLSRAKQLSETVILSGGASHPGGSLQLGMGEKPKFGRFEVQKELGKGAMGVVYLGKDPKIGREVAIKTLALSQEFEADELADVKQRFFREAETAGRKKRCFTSASSSASNSCDRARVLIATSRPILGSLPR